jgi:hypothetical protein
MEQARPHHCRRPAATRRGARAGIARLRAELLLDPQELVVFRDTIRSGQRAGLDLRRRVPTAMSAIVVSSVSPERCDTTDA